MKLLHVDSSIQGEASASRLLSAKVVERLGASHPDLSVTYRDLAAAPLPHLTLDAFGGPQAQQILREFLEADIVVIGAGLYNFTIPSQLKSWFDRVLVAGQTFRYGAAGPEGLAGGKRVIVALARGGVYSADAPAAPFEHAETLLRSLLTFIGITDPEVIVAEGLKVSEEARATALEAALVQAAALMPGRLAA